VAQHQIPVFDDWKHVGSWISDNSADNYPKVPKKV